MKLSAYEINLMIEALNAGLKEQKLYLEAYERAQEHSGVELHPGLMESCQSRIDGYNDLMVRLMWEKQRCT